MTSKVRLWPMRKEMNSQTSLRIISMLTQLRGTMSSINLLPKKVTRPSLSNLIQPSQIIMLILMEEVEPLERLNPQGILFRSSSRLNTNINEMKTRLEGSLILNSQLV